MTSCALKKWICWSTNQMKSCPSLQNGFACEQTKWRPVHLYKMELLVNKQNEDLCFSAKWNCLSTYKMKTCVSLQNGFACQQTKWRSVLLYKRVLLVNKQNEELCFSEKWSCMSTNKMKSCASLQNGFACVHIGWRAIFHCAWQRLAMLVSIWNEEFSSYCAWCHRKTKRSVRILKFPCQHTGLGTWNSFEKDKQSKWNSFQ